jgi:adenylate cyclase
MEKSTEAQEQVNEMWRTFLMGEAEFAFRRLRHVHTALPSSPRCKLCAAPFGGPGGAVMRFTGKGRSRMNPNICNSCERFAQDHPGGAEIPLSLLFADIRGSTTLAESLGTARFSALIARFYSAVTQELLKVDALIDRLIGDEVIALFVPVLAGDKHKNSQAALEGAKAILKATGHGTTEGPWVPIGVGIHTGTAFVGAVGSSGVTDITALGDDVNLTARLASLAQAGEILITEATRAAAGVPTDGLEARHIEVKGRSEPVDVWVMHNG